MTFDIRREEGLFVIEPHWRAWLEHHHPDATAHPTPLGTTYRFDDGYLEVSDAEDSITTVIGGAAEHVETGFLIEHDFDQWGDMVPAPSRECAIKHTDKTITTTVSDGSIITNTFGDGYRVARSIITNDGVTTFPDRLHSGHWEVSAHAVTQSGKRLAEKVRGSWVWRGNHQDWLHHRADLRVSFRGCEFDLEGVPVI